MATKPVINYQAGSDNPITRPISVVQKRLEVGYENWANKTEMTDFVDQLFVPPTSDSYINIVCSCGLEYDYVDKAAVPSVDLDCSCGRKLIKYGN